MVFKSLKKYMLVYLINNIFVIKCKFIKNLLQKIYILYKKIKYVYKKNFEVDK